MQSRKLLITGCGRSGTLYATELWRALDLDIRHERPVPPNGVMGDDGMASWFMAADDPITPSGPSALDYKFDFTIHQVRHPLKVIASVAQFIIREGQRAPDFIKRNIPEFILFDNEKLLLDEKQQLILRAANYWYHWNLLTEKKADYLVQVENLDSTLPDLCNLVGVDYKPDITRKIPNNINERRFHIQDEPWEIEWDDIKCLDQQLYENVRTLAASYDYNG